MSVKYYLDQDGTRELVNYINNGLSVKLEQADLADYATKAELADLDVDVDLTGYATETFVQNQIAAIPAFDDSEIQAQLEALEEKTGGLYHFKGSVADLAALEAIESPEVGDTYNLLDTGMNAAWTGEAWDQFGSVADLSEYAKIADIQAISEETLNSILFSGKKAVVSTPGSLKAMISNSQNSVEITLNDDVALTEAMVIPAGKEVTINLEGNDISSGTTQAFVANGIGSKVILQGQGTISGAANSIVSAADGGEVIIDGVDVVSTNNNGSGARGVGSKITINSGSITGQEYGVIVTHGATAEINGGTLKGIDNFALGGNGSAFYDTVEEKLVSKENANTIPVEPTTVTINGGTFEGHITSPGYMATAIYWPNVGTLNFNAGTIVTDGAGIVQRGGTVNIGADAVIMPSNTPVNFETGFAGDSKNPVGRFGIVYDYQAKYPAQASMALNIANGAQITGIDGDLSILPEDAPNVTDLR